MNGENGLMQTWAAVLDKCEDWLWKPLLRSQRLEPAYPLADRRASAG